MANYIKLSDIQKIGSGDKLDPSDLLLVERPKKDAEVSRVDNETPKTMTITYKDFVEALDQWTPSDPGAHNTVYLGRNLGHHPSAEHWKAFKDKTLKGMYLGDYWTGETGGTDDQYTPPNWSGGSGDYTEQPDKNVDTEKPSTVNRWRIAGFNYYLRSGATRWGGDQALNSGQEVGDKGPAGAQDDLKDWHAVIVPDFCLYNAQMNSAATVEHGYLGSEMRKKHIVPATMMILGLFGVDHVLTYRKLFTNHATDGHIDPYNGHQGVVWTDSIVDLMNENMVYGTNIFIPRNDQVTDAASYCYYEVDKGQLPLFAARHDLIIGMAYSGTAAQESTEEVTNRSWYWLRDIVNGECFAGVSGDGSSSFSLAHYSNGVRPAFIIGDRSHGSGSTP